jgi:peptide chain release factor
MPTGLSVVARDERSQHRNKALALRRLAEVLRLREDLAAIADRQQA